MNKFKTFREILINEMTTSAATPGYQTPNAFTGEDEDRLIKKFSSILKWEVNKKRKNIKTFSELNNLNESIDPRDYDTIKDLIRAELASIMYILFKKRSFWMSN